MEHNLGLNNSELNFSGEYRDTRAEAFEFWLENAHNDSSDYRWHTNWEVVHTKKNRSIGGASFLGEPNKKGEVILGYIIDKDFRNKGYMTEAVSAISDWALQHGGAKRVISFIEHNSKDSKAVNKLLKKCGFKKEVRYVKQ